MFVIGLEDGGDTLRSVLIDIGGATGVIASGVRGAACTAGGDPDDQISWMRFASSDTEVSRNKSGVAWILCLLSVAIGTKPE